ncbi:recombinase zinc beta ribbon domain-containing protein [Streptomyces sp. NPDC091972]|uniref:recombinase zinc beta ribbon domain-containing protein n=1 Tax=Streptomyces sp. NPDC091972 TaxID=3366007 RepID=UPI00381A09DE
MAHCTGCDGRMYFAARKGYAYGDYVCRATARGEDCPAAAAMRSDWLEAYVLDEYCRMTGENDASRERLLVQGVRVTVAKGRPGGGPARYAGPDVSRLTFTLGQRKHVRQTG